MNHSNKVEIIGSYGGDKTHALSAWSSTFLELGMDLPDKIENRVDVIVDHILSNSKRMRSIEDLLAFLAENNHASPFEFSFLHFATTEDYKSHIHLLKHRIGHSKNSESTRYKERVDDKFYLPTDWNHDIIESVIDANTYYVYASGHDNAYFGAKHWVDVLKNYTELGNSLYHQCIKDLTPVLGKVRAKESAAYFLTLNNQINTNDAWNFRSFVQFQRLRNSPHAQQEIRELAQMMLDEVKNIPGNPFEYSLKAFKL
jgi:flavin-dependent thymidylate synthase